MQKHNASDASGGEKKSTPIVRGNKGPDFGNNKNQNRGGGKRSGPLGGQKRSGAGGARGR